MYRRASSPAPSEPEVDILGSLFTDDVETTTGRHKKGSGANAGFNFDDAEGIFNDLEDDENAADDDGDEAFIALRQAASFRKASNLKGKSVKKGGGFQAMGLNANLLKAITRKGFSVPTPIQRKSIPLILDRKDVVGMARTGSGKTAAFVIPMIERLRAHSARIGCRALVLSPSRELALQTLKVVKELSKGTDLKCILLVGGDSLEEQFAAMTSNPDIVIATPGRFLHLKVEMSLDLFTIQYVVFDEADRLFEMGFAAQLTEILHALPLSRQTLLFSATLPASLVEFARAGLQDPSLVRLDAETKISPDLENAFFSVKGAEKEGALLHILHDVIKMPVGLPEGVQEEADKPTKKRKRGPDLSAGGKGKPTKHSTILFAATKHHVEYLAALLKHAGFAVSYVYGSLDQTARQIQVDDFRRGGTNILVVTDVAARGIDIPVLANVINFDFPPQPKVFVHRVGRTARAGQRGWSFSLVRDVDAPYLIDLQLFLGRRLVVGHDNAKPPSFSEDVVVGALARSAVESNVEWVNKLLGDSEEIGSLRRVASKAEKLYMRTRNSASSQSAKRAREMASSKAWSQTHALFGGETGALEEARAEMLAKISGFRPHETIFEIGQRGKALQNEAAEVMRNLRARITPRRQKELDKQQGEAGPRVAQNNHVDEESEDGIGFDDQAGEDQADDDDDDDELEVEVSAPANVKDRGSKSSGGSTSFQDQEVFMSYTPRTVNAAEEKGYGVHSGSANANFVEAARGVTMDLGNEDGAKALGGPTRTKMRWDKKNSKYVSRENDLDGSRGPRMIKGESGVRIAASFQSGRFDRWRRAQRLGRMPAAGSAERPGASSGPGAAQNGGAPRYKHKQEKAPKEADKYRDDYPVRKRRVAEAREKRVGRFRDGAGSAREVKGAHDIRKSRQLTQARREKNARPVKKGKK